MKELLSLEDLLDLQVVDLEIDRLLNERQSLPELESYRIADTDATEIARQKAAADGALRKTDLELDRTSGELDLAEEKLATEQNRLYAGGLSARDATYLRQEVQMLERKNGDMEDVVLALLETRETQAQDAVDVAERLEVAKAEKARFEAFIQSSWSAIDARIAKKEARKSDIVPLITSDLIELYEDLREIKDGVAVARLAEDVCGGCHLRLTASEQLEMRQSEPQRCLHCRRILVV